MGMVPEGGAALEVPTETNSLRRIWYAGPWSGTAFGLTKLLAAELLWLPNHQKLVEPSADPPTACAKDVVENGDKGATGFACAIAAGVRVAAAATAHAAVLARNLFTSVDIFSPNPA